MNFKGFLKSRYSYIFEEILNEDDNAAKDSFVRNAYRRVFKDKADNSKTPDEMWIAVLNKANYRLTKNSKPDTRKAVQIAKGAKTQARTRFTDLKQDLDDSEKEVLETDQKIIKHLEDWTAKDIDDLKTKLSEKGFNQDFTDKVNLVILKDQNELNKLSDEEKKNLFDAIKDCEEEEKTETEWKDKTFDDLESITPEDFEKVKDRLKNFIGFENVNSLDDLKNKHLRPDQIEELNKLIEQEPKTPSEPQESQQDSKEPQVVPDTTNQETLARIQEQQKAEKLQKKLRDNNIPVKEDGSPDFDNPETLKKINDLMVNGDDELYNEFVRSKGGEKSDLAREIQERSERENEIIQQDLENRQARREHEVESQKRLCNFALALDIICSALSGKATDVFSSLAEKRGKSKAIEKSLAEGMNQKIEDEVKQLEEDHAKELDSIETHKKQRLEQLEKDRSNPTQTLAYKRKSMEIMTKHNEKVQAHKEKGKTLESKVSQNNSIQSALFALDNGTPIDDEKLKSIFPKDPNEDDATYVQKIETLKSKSPEDLKTELENIKEQNQTEIDQFNEETQNLDKELNDELQALKEDPDVKNELKNSEEDYEFKKKNILSETQSLIDKENERLKKKIRTRKQIIDENKRFAKNISTMMAWSSNPEDVLASEMLVQIKRQKTLLNSIGEQTNPEDFPEDLEAIKKMIKEKMSNPGGSKTSGKSSSSRRGFDDDDDEIPVRRPQGRLGRSGETEPAKVETKNGKQAYNDIMKKFNGKQKAQSRLTEFLKNNGIENPETADETKLQDLTKKFNEQKFPEGDELTSTKLKELGIKKDDGSEFTEDDIKNLSDNDIKKLKEEYGFEDSTTPVKNEPLKVENAEGVKKLKLGTLKVGDKDYNLDNLSDDEYNTIRNSEEFKKKLQEPSTLAKISGTISDDEKNEVNNLKDGDKDDSTKLGDLSFKALWKKLNDKGISIRALPGYDRNLPEDKKKELVSKYIKDHINDFGLNESRESKHRKTAFIRLNEVSQAQKRMSERRSLKKFSELLVHDVRTFGV